MPAADLPARNVMGLRWGIERATAIFRRKFQLGMVETGPPKL